MTTDHRLDWQLHRFQPLDGLRIGLHIGKAQVAQLLLEDAVAIEHLLVGEVDKDAVRRVGRARVEGAHLALLQREVAIVHHVGQHQRQIRILRQPLAGKGDNLGPVALHQIPGLARRHHLGPDGLPVGVTARPVGVVVGVDHLQHRLAADPFNELVQLASGIRRPGRPHHRHPLGPEIDHGVLFDVVVVLHHIDRAAHLLEGDPRRPHAATPETRHQHHGPGQPALHPTFHHLAPSNQPPPRHPCGKPGLLSSGQKIRGICEGKMRLCEV